MLEPTYYAPPFDSGRLTWYSERIHSIGSPARPQVKFPPTVTYWQSKSHLLPAQRLSIRGWRSIARIRIQPWQERLRTKTASQPITPKFWYSGSSSPQGH